MSLMFDLVERVREEVMSRSVSDADPDDDDYRTETTETDEDYRERMESILDDVANEIILDYDRLSEAIAEWFSEDVLMRTNHADLVSDVLHINIINMNDTNARDMLILKACVIDDYRTMYPYGV